MEKTYEPGVYPQNWEKMSLEDTFSFVGCIANITSAYTPACIGKPSSLALFKHHSILFAPVSVWAVTIHL